MRKLKAKLFLMLPKGQALQLLNLSMPDSLRAKRMVFSKGLAQRIRQPCDL